MECIRQQVENAVNPEMIQNPSSHQISNVNNVNNFYKIHFYSLKFFIIKIYCLSSIIGISLITRCVVMLSLFEKLYRRHHDGKYTFPFLDICYQKHRKINQCFGVFRNKKNYPTYECCAELDHNMIFTGSGSQMSFS